MARPFPERAKLGSILRQAGLLSEEDLARAVEEQRKHGGRLGDVLLRLGLVNETDIAQALARQLGLRFARFEDLRPDPRLAQRLPEAVARQLGVVLLGEEAGRLHAATCDPLDSGALQEVHFLLGAPVQPVVVSPSTLDRLLVETYRPPGEAAPAPPEAAGESAPLLDRWIGRAVAEGASDIHIEPTESGLRVRFRRDGVLQEIARLPAGVRAPVISRLKVLAHLDIAEQRRPQDGALSYALPGTDRRVDLRVTTLPTLLGEKAAIRILDRRQVITRLDRLGFLPGVLAPFRQLIQAPFGMLLVTGPTGSGKTTTLTAVLSELNTPERNIVTIEDPVEYRIDGVNQVQVNPKAGLTFASGLRAFLRQDPDVLMVGEIRDAETASIAVRAALTGHLVLSTLHANDAPGGLVRLLDMGVEPDLVAASLLGVLSQRLVRALCPWCRSRRELPPGDPRRRLFRLPGSVREVPRATGCNYCHHVGYQGRLPLTELLVLDDALRTAVAARASGLELRRIALERGMQTLREDGVRKVLAGQTTLEEIQRVVFSPAERAEGEPAAQEGDG